MSVLIAIACLVAIGIFWRQIIVGVGFVVILIGGVFALFAVSNLVESYVDPPPAKAVAYVAPDGGSTMRRLTVMAGNPNAHPVGPAADPFAMAGAAPAGWTPPPPSAVHTQPFNPFRAAGWGPAPASR